MKLLGWMHRKFRQNTGDPIRDLPIGSTCNCLSARPSPDDPLSPAIRALPVGDRHVWRAGVDDELPPFEGLLSIGTLGSAGSLEGEEAEAEKEAELLEAIGEKEEGDGATEREMRVVRSELEKVLREAAEKEGDGRLSSARPSHASSVKAANEACPLQEYLLGAVAVEEAELEKEEKRRRREKRASLGELFKIEEGEGGRAEEVGGGEQGKDASAVKKMIKRRGSRLDSRKPASSVARAGGGGGGEVGGNAKFRKILQIFQRKIHPDNDVPSKKHTKSGKYKSCPVSNCLIGGSGDFLMSPLERTSRKERETGLNCGAAEQCPSLDWSDSTSNREHWIKTDAEYLVLEL